MNIGNAIVRASEWFGMRCDDALKEEWIPEKEHPLPYFMYILVMLAAALLILSGVLYNDVPFRDVAQRYAPMADAFASGNFAYAFHPGIPMLHPILAGCVSFLTGCSGFTAAKIVSLLFFTLSVIPLMALMRRVYSTNIAIAAGYVYLIAAPLIRLGFSGLREMEKCFLILLAAYALVRIYQERDHWSGYLWAGIAAGLAVLTRVDLILYAGLAVLCAVRFDTGKKRIPLRSLSTCGIALLLSFPALFLNWKTTGAVVPDSRLAHFFPAGWTLFFIVAVIAIASAYGICMIWVRLSAKVRRLTAAAAIFAGAAVILVSSIRLGLFADPEAGYKYIRSIWNGVFSYLGIFSIAGIIFRLFQRKWKKEETILLALYLLHAAVLLSVILLLERKLYVSARYLLPALPLSFGWVVIGFIVPLHYLGMLIEMAPHGQFLFRAVCYIMFLGFALGTWYYSFAPLDPQRLSERKRTEREAILDFSRRIRDREAARKEPRAWNPPPFHMSEYHSGLPLRVCFLEKVNGKWRKSRERIQVIAYLAHARISAGGEPSDYAVTMRGAQENGSAVKQAHLLSRRKDKHYIYELWSYGK